MSEIQPVLMNATDARRLRALLRRSFRAGSGLGVVETPDSVTYMLDRRRIGELLGTGSGYQWAQITALASDLTTLTVKLLDESGQVYGAPIVITPDGFADNQLVTVPNLRMLLPAATVGSPVRVEQRLTWPAAGWKLWDRHFPAQHWVRIQSVNSPAGTFEALFLEPGPNNSPNGNGSGITVKVWAAGLSAHTQSAPLTDFPFLKVAEDVLVAFRAGPYAGWWYQGPAPWTCTT